MAAATELAKAENDDPEELERIDQEILAANEKLDAMAIDNPTVCLFFTNFDLSAESISGMHIAFASLCAMSRVSSSCIVPYLY